MSSDSTNGVKKVFNLLSELAAFLLFGTFIALVWANIDYESYHHFVDAPLFYSEVLNHKGDHGVSFHFLVNDLFMVLFFGIAGKEVAESFLPGGALSSIKKASMPAIATAGGVLGPIATFFALHAIMAPDPGFAGGWAIPTATDIAYCWLFAGLVFGRAHPAVTFLLVLAVLDDLIGMLIIATVYTPEVHPAWLGLVAVAMVICEVMRRLGVKSFWPYFLIGAPLCWFGLHNTGVHAALALVPIVPFMPHAERDAGLFQSPDTDRDGDVDSHDAHDDTMNRFEHFFKPIVDVGLFGFGLANAGVVLTMENAVSEPTLIILISLLVGKTVGVFLFCFVANKAGLELPEHVTIGQTAVIGLLAGIGFTVALFVTTVYVGLDPSVESIAGQLKLGALFSFVAGPLGFLFAKMMKVKKIHTADAAGGHAGHH
jgi:NhaA family Na+:H+ antiporter